MFLGEAVTEGKQTGVRRERTCAACRQADSPEGLVRWVRGEDGDVAPDLLAKSFGRGAWVHAKPACMRRLPQALSQSFRASISTDLVQAMALLEQASQLQVARLLGAARRQGRIEAGGAVSEQAFEGGKAALVIVAQDAQAAAQRPWVASAVSRGLVSVWGTKESLGALLGAPPVAVLAVLDHRLAKNIFGAIAMALLAKAVAAEANAKRKPDETSGTEVE
jgi:predicted RNA-binding protein YlxR (DUF448 family)